MEEIRGLPSWLRYGVMSAVAGTALANIGLFLETPVGVGGLFPILVLAVSKADFIGSAAILGDLFVQNLIMAGFWFIIGALLWKFESTWIAFGIWIVVYVAATLTVWFFALG
ncbi:MAG: hypothetical protein P8X64_02245 [Anaerolineales bacterium]|jgi:hypothetical protein